MKASVVIVAVLALLTGGIKRQPLLRCSASRTSRTPWSCVTGQSLAELRLLSIT